VSVVVSPNEEERARVEGQFSALRHTRPDVELPHPAHPDDRDLLLRALHRKNGAPLLAWAIGDPEASALLARVALRAELSGLRDTVRGVRLASQSGYPIPSGVEARLGGLVNLPEASEALTELASLQNASASSSALRSVLRQFRSVYHPLHPIDSDTVLDGQELITELLELPDGVDPVEWLMLERSREAALRAFRLVLQQVVPPTEDWLGKTIKVLRPKKRISSSRGYEVVISEVTLMTSGFTVATRIRMPFERLREYGQQLSFPQWRGFEQAVDNFGHQYVIQPVQAASGRNVRGWEHQLRVACFPALADTADGLTLSASSSPLTCISKTSGDEAERLVTAGAFGDVVWTLRL
jgi:hypothetical protein